MSDKIHAVRTASDSVAQRDAEKIARESFGKKSWPNQAWTIFGVETHVCDIPDINRAALVEAQLAQDLRSDFQTLDR